MKYFFVVSIFIFLATGIFLWQGIYLPKYPDLVKEELFSVEKGQNFFQIAKNLENKDLIKWAPMFQVYVLFAGISGNLQAGSYYLSSSMNIPEITGKFVRGDVAKMKATIPEGFTIKQIEEKLNIKIDPNLEGFLFPDTYYFSYFATNEEIIKMMIDNFNRKTAHLKITPEIVIMASLLEKEVRTFEDKKLVSGIFWRRIKAGIPMQSCATIAYILQREDWTFREMLKEIGKGKKIDSPYNTYMYKGLPIGPISNPGLESILAAIYPKASDYWFFLSTPKGETIFSRTLAEHNIAKAKYLRY